MKPYCFFAHIAFTFDAHAHATPQATANLLIEINDTTLKSCAKKEHVKVPLLTDAQKAELAGKVAMAAGLDYLRSEDEFHQFPAQRFVNFDLIRPPSYISVRPRRAKSCRMARRYGGWQRVRPVSYEANRSLFATPKLNGDWLLIPF